MIKINHMSQKIYDVMSKRFSITKDTSMKARVMRISVLWRDADEAIREKECSRFVFSRLELVLADIILLCIALLHSTGVRNIETLLHRRLKDNEKHNKQN